MIRLAARLAVSGGRESIVRLALTALGVAIGTTLLLVAAAADPAIRAQQRHTAWQYTGITGDPGPAPSDLTADPDPLRWSLTTDAVDGREMTVLRVAAMGPDAPIPLGLSHVPQAGEVYVSPALAQLLEELPADRLADRFPSAPTGRIGDDYLAGPDDLVVVIGMTADELQGPPLSRLAISRSATSAPSRPSTSSRTSSASCSASAPSACCCPCSSWSAPRPASAQRAASSASPLSASPAPRHSRPVSSPPSRRPRPPPSAPRSAGWASRSFDHYVARIEIDGHQSFVDDVGVAPVLLAVILVAIPMLAVVAAAVSLRRLQISPLGVARRAVRPRPTVRRLVPLLVGTAGFAASLAIAANNTGIGMLVPVMAAFALMVYGIVAAGPWFTVLTARAIARTGRRASVLLAGRRLEDDPVTGFRAVSGLVLAVFVASVFSGVTPAVLAEGGSHHSGLIEGTTMVAGLGSETSAAAARVALDAAASAGAGPGIVLHQDPQRRLADPAVGPSDTRLAACADIQRFGVTDPCPTGGTAWIDTSTDELRLQPAPYTPAQIVDLPAQLLVVQTDGTTATTDRVRTAIERTVPGAVPWVGAEADAAANRRLTQLNRVANLALAVTLTIAGCSLAVAVAAGIIERKRPFALLRLAGMHLAELQRTALLEAAAPLLLIASASALLGLGTSAVIVSLAGGIPWKPPTIGYWLSLAGGLTVALGVAAAALPLLNRTTAPSAVRFE